MSDLVSIIITTYNGQDNIGRAIDSCLNQTYSSIEVIVVDDNSKDSKSRTETEFVMGKYDKDNRVRYIKHDKNMNGSAARNTGIQAAKGKYIQLLDDDDYLFPTKIEKTIETIELYPKCKMVVTGVIALSQLGIVDLSGAQQKAADMKLSREWLLRFNALGTGSNLFATRESILSIGGFDTSYIRMQDIEFIFRFCEKFRVCSIPDRLIIKDLNTRPLNHKAYKKNEDVIMKFIGQFDIIIQSLLSESEAYQWYNEQYSHLLRLALAEGNFQYIQIAKNRVQTLRKLSIGEKIKCTSPKIWFLVKTNPILFKVIERRRNGSTVQNTLEKCLTAYEKVELEKYRSYVYGINR